MSSIILAIDPGPTKSAGVFYERETGLVTTPGTLPNEELLRYLLQPAGPLACVVIEKVEGYGMPVGVEVFDTVFWSGKFAQAADPVPVHRIGRKAVKLHLCQSMRAKDPNIRQALIDRYGPDAIGRKAAPGPLYGIVGDVWSALAVAVTYADSL